MELEIRDTQSSKTFTIPASGMTLGRDGSAADLAVPDRTVSSRHARIYAQGDAWFIEDLQSSNGTYVEGERIDAPKALTRGSQFSLCRYSYEVVQVVGDNLALVTGELESSFRELDALDPATTLPGGMPLTGSRPRPAPTSVVDVSGSEPGNMTAPVRGDRDAHELRPEGALDVIGTALAHYLVAAPLLLVTPWDAVRSGIERSKFGVLRPSHLWAFSGAAHFIGLLVTALSVVAFQLGWGHMAVAHFTTPIIVFGVSLAVSAAVAWIWFPLLRWLVTLLGGRVSEKEATNCFVMLHTGAILAFLPTVVAPFLGLAGVALLGVIPLVLAMLVNLILAFVSFAWLRSFSVASWFPRVVMVLGVAACVQPAWGLVLLFRAPSAAETGTSQSTGEQNTGDMSPEAVQRRIAELNKELHAAAANGADAEELAARAQELQKLRVAAAHIRNGGVPAVRQAQTDGTDAGGSEATETGVNAPESQQANSGSGEDGELGSSEADRRARVGHGKVEAGRAAAETGRTPYQSFLFKRTAIEEALEKDPSLLKRTGAEGLYKELHKIVFKLTQNHKVRVGKKLTAEKAAQQKVAEKLRDAEIFEQAGAIVDKLYDRLVGGSGG